MKHSNLRLPFLLVLIALTPALLPADGNTTGATPRIRMAVPNPQQDSKEPSEGIRFDLNFPGGSAQELIAALSEASGQPVNAIIPESADRFVMPPLNLHNVTVDQVLPLLRFENSVFDARMKSYHNSSYSWRRADVVWTMIVDVPPEPIPLQYTVYPLFIGNMLTSYSIEDITTAIDTAWSLNNAGSDESQLLFHPETSILLIKGTQQELEIMEKVILTMKNGQDHLDRIKREQEAIEVTILGDAGSQGVIRLTPPSDNIIGAFAESGAYRASNSKDYEHTAQINRRHGDKIEEINVDLNPILFNNMVPIPVQNGDIIIFSQKRIQREKQ